ncbi:MAG: VC0807 family protein [Bernardetiaceae bacterium]
MKNNARPSLLNLLLNIVVPVIILTKFSKPESLGPVWGLVLALLFPLGYGAYERVREKKWNTISVIGLISVLLTGAIGLFKLPPEWVAIKEAAVPLVIGAFVLFSLRTPFPVVRKLLYNEAIFDTQKIENQLHTADQQQDFSRNFVQATYWVAASFLLSSVLNYVLAKVIVKSPPDTAAFNEEIGQMMALSFPVIAIPSTLVLFFALWQMIKGIQRITGLSFEELFQGQEYEKK